MRTIYSKDFKPVSRDSAKSTAANVSERELRSCVEQIAKPRHFVAEKKQNEATANWITAFLTSIGLKAERQGEFSNIIGYPTTLGTSGMKREVALIGAHYDSVPNSAGADDNASAIAAMLGCAVVCTRMNPKPAVVFAAFNREEEGFLGSADFVESYLRKAPFQIRCAHILEMIGYANSSPGSQRVPTGLPIQLGDCGDFLGLLSNDQSGSIMDSVIARGVDSVPELSITGLEVGAGAERVFPVLARSDHVPFWRAKIPALMWTDTAEFRNPNYHQPTDTPETLNYTFLRSVTELLVRAVSLATTMA